MNILYKILYMKKAKQYIYEIKLVTYLQLATRMFGYSITI